MCGIAGILGFDQRPVFASELRRMCNAMSHRGPDDEGVYLRNDVGLGMRRLSIIDLKTGRQPISNEDGSIHVVFNGEIYNFEELRQDLEARGHAFRTSTDTEAIVHLYEEHGDRCVDSLRGMFTFALWDERRRLLLLARDRLGIKPLYYTVADGRLLFASELKALLQLPDIERKLAPGHILVARSDGRLRIEPYWDVTFAPDRDRSEAWFAERLRELLDESVRLHLVSDVPLGAFLSGGIDSSSVVAAAARLTSGPVKTFSIGFAEADYNELHHARRVAARFGTEHHELVLEPDALGIMVDLAWFLD